jgi:hypothetical protein
MASGEEGGVTAGVYAGRGTVIGLGPNPGAQRGRGGRDWEMKNRQPTMGNWSSSGLPGCQLSVVGFALAGGALHLVLFEQPGGGGDTEKGKTANRQWETGREVGGPVISCRLSVLHRLAVGIPVSRGRGLRWIGGERERRGVGSQRVIAVLMNGPRWDIMNCMSSTAEWAEEERHDP